MHKIDNSTVEFNWCLKGHAVQITHNLNDTHVSHVCQNKKHAWNQTTCWHKCKINAPHTHAYPYKVLCHETILLTTSSALHLIIYTFRTILGGIVTNILGHPRHTIIVATCS